MAVRKTLLDLESLRLDPSSVGKPKPPRKRKKWLNEPFVNKAPRRWLVKAYEIASGSGVMIALALWYLSGMKRRDRTVRLTNLEAERWGVSRQSKWRALASLVEAGLITVERRPKTSPLVTILDMPEEEVGE